MISFILSIALVNTGVGFALAVYLGWRYRRLVAMEINTSPSYFLGHEMLAPAGANAGPAPLAAPAARVLAEPSATLDEPDQSSTSTFRPSDASTVEVSPPDAPPSAVSASDVAAADVPPSTGSASDMSPREMSPNDAAVLAQSPQLHVEPADAAVDASPPPASKPTATPTATERGPTETAVGELRGRINRYQEQVIDVDSLLRQFGEASEVPDRPRVETCLKTLHEANAEYLETRGEAYRNLQESQVKAGLAVPAMEDLRVAVEAETQQIESAQAAVEAIDYQGDLAQVCRQMTDHTVRLSGANHALRDVLDQTWAPTSVAQKWRTPADEARADGLMAGLADRAALEAALARWQETRAASAQPLCIAAIDVDQLARINERYGPRTGDRLLHALAQLLVREGSHNNVVGRVSGQRFAVLFPEGDLRLTTSVVERIRQMIEISHFLCQGNEIQVTVSCAVIEARSPEDFAALLLRADAAIQEAKRYGRNRTFLYEGEYPTPVVPPNFALEEKSIEL